MSDPNLRAMLEALDRSLAAALEHSRGAFQHAGTQGDAAERALRETLDAHLPRYYAVGTGEVIDRADTRSGQVDVIIANQDQPFRTGIDQPGVFFIDGVGAAGEVKSRLTAQELARALAGATRFKKLRGQDYGINFGANTSDQRRFFDCPPYFLFAFESSLAPATLMKRLQSTPLVTGADGSGDPLSPLDGVFILGQGVAINYGDGQGTLGYRYESGPHAGQIATGWVWQPRTEGVFIYLLLWLSSVMPRFIRFESVALDYLVKLAMPPRDSS